MTTLATPMTIPVLCSDISIDGRDCAGTHPDLDLQDSTVHVWHWNGHVHAGLGAVLHAHAGVTYTAGDGACVYHYPGAAAELEPGQLERGEITVVDVLARTGR